ncbi:MAG: GTP 3',8-cyclase MoaA [Xanthomonadaceae bacterium]|jgi:cyclic pyranopterin phosphate synthase|nr:GTP 3',8-cyclase MoaA [Xanthomonadaceae bacterium]
MNTLMDSYGRLFPYLRLSLTEACNFRCTYCLPDGYRPDGHPVFLTRAEIGRLLRAFAALGMDKIRLTGGEPSLRRDLSAIIATTAATDGIRTIALTTNGYQLRKRVEQWREAGLTALNISVDSLDRGRFQRITGHDRCDDIRQGIETALTLGFDSIKLNAVLLRGLNDDGLEQWLDYLRDRDLSVRFIELMRTGDNREYFQHRHLDAEMLERQIQQAGWRPRARAANAGPAREYGHPDFKGRIGIIAPYARDFCKDCNRLRVTARGDLRLCLFGDFSIPLRPLLRTDADHEALVGRIAAQLGLKAAGHGLHQGHTGITPHLASVGG